MYSPRFTYRHSIVNNLMRVEGARRVVDILPLPPDVGLQLKQQARQRATHHSTRIEGNKLKETAVQHAVANPSRRAPDEIEVRNYWRALEWIEIQTDKQTPVTENTIGELHAIIYPTGPGRGRKRSIYRVKEIGVIDQALGDYEYMAPVPKDVPGLMADLAQWIASEEATLMPAPVRAATLAYQFVTIHPFDDGNGRTARALATWELWRSGYSLRGFLSMEEHYTRDIARYYASLQMEYPQNYYDGRNDPDLTPWLDYFCLCLADAAEEVREVAAHFHTLREGEDAHLPWESLSRLQQQVLNRCLTLAVEGRSPISFAPLEVAQWFGVAPKTARDWLADWREGGFVKPVSEHERIRQWKLTREWQELVLLAAANILNSDRVKGSVDQAASQPVGEKSGSDPIS